MQQGLKFLEKISNSKSGIQTKIGSDPHLKTGFYIKNLDIFTTSYILDLVHDLLPNKSKTKLDLDKFIENNQGFGLHGYFANRNLVPDDIDTTSVVTWARLLNKMGIKEAKLIGKAIVLNTEHSNGIIGGYFPPFGRSELHCLGRVEVSMSCNAMRLLLKLGMEDQAKLTQDFIFQVLNDQTDFKKVSSYYKQLEVFYYFLSNCIILSDKFREIFGPILTAKFKGLLTSSENIFEDYGKSPIKLSLIILIANNLDILNNLEVRNYANIAYEKLKLLQSKDGSWPSAEFYSYSGKNPYVLKGFSEEHPVYYFGCEALSTAFAIKALYIYDQKFI